MDSFKKIDIKHAVTMLNETMKQYLELDSIYVYSDNIYNFRESDQKELKELASNITSCNKMDDVLRLTSWVSRIPWDASLENIHPLKLVGESGDCYFHSLLFAALARTVGIPTRFVEEVRRIPAHVISNFQTNADTFGENYTFHIWCEVFVDGIWIPVDPTENVVGREDFELYFKNPEFLKIKVVRDETEDVTNEYVLRPLKQYAEKFGMMEMYAQIEAEYTNLNSNVGSMLYYCRPLYEEKANDIAKLYSLLIKFNKNVLKKQIGYQGFIPVDTVQLWLDHLWEYKIGNSGNVMIITDTVLAKERKKYENFVINGGSLLVAAMNNVQIFDIIIEKNQNERKSEMCGKAHTPFGDFEDITVSYAGEMTSGDMYLEDKNGYEENNRFYFGALTTKGTGRLAVINYALLMPYRDHRAFLRRLLTWLFEIQP